MFYVFFVLGIVVYIVLAFVTAGVFAGVDADEDTAILGSACWPITWLLFFGGVAYRLTFRGLMWIMVSVAKRVRGRYEQRKKLLR